MRLQIMTCQGVLILKQDQLSENADEEPLELGYSLFDTHMRLSRAFHAMKTDTRTCARALGLGPGQPRILSYLAAHGVSTQREIARYLVIDPSAVSRMLDALERGGFVQSVPGAIDVAGRWVSRSMDARRSSVGMPSAAAWTNSCLPAFRLRSVCSSTICSIALAQI